MCGVFAINRLNVSAADREVISRSLSFRGPDYQSDFIEHAGWTIFHSRLAIIGLKNDFNQPFRGEDGGYLLFNGEILNFEFLGKSILNKPYQSDTHFLSDFITSSRFDIKLLEGFFSFIYIDACGILRWAARDRFGVKPLFVYQSKQTLAFSSEAATFERLFNCGVSQSAMEEYRSLRYPIFSGSYFNHVTEVDPGSCFVNKKYFSCLEQLTEDYTPVSEEELKNTLQRSITSRGISDVKVGLLISKGIDSNLINKFGKFDRLFSSGFKEDADLKYVKENFENIVTVSCEPDEYRKVFKSLRELRGEPLSVPNEVLLYMIALKARENGIKVLMSGEGADEFFAGYDRIFCWANKMKNKFCVDEFISYYCYKRPEKDTLLYTKFESLFQELVGLSCFEKIRYFFVRYHLPILFRRLDFALMAAGVEGREPLATFDMFKLASRLSPHDLVNLNIGKLPLRNLLQKSHGISFAMDKKIGFPVNLSHIYSQFDKLTNYEIWYEINRW